MIRSGRRVAPLMLCLLGLVPGTIALAQEYPPEEAELALAPTPRPSVSGIFAAWRDPAPSLADRSGRIRRASLESGVWNLDPAARAIIAGAVGGDPLERARAAVRIAPDLPAAHMALASALWLEEGSPIGAVRAAGGALLAIPRHPESAFWFGGSLLYVLAWGLALGGLLTVAVAGMLAVPDAAHDLGDALSGSMPAPSRAALVAAVVLLPVACGQGGLGLCLALFALGFIYGGALQRGVLAVAVLGFAAGAFPVARLAGATLGAFSSDPVAESALLTAVGPVSSTDAARLAWSSESDALALRAVAAEARRAGHLAEADAHYQVLVAAPDADPSVINNAANVRLELGHMESALDLYGRAVESSESPVALFNLSQAHGRAFRVEELTAALELAQRVDSDLVSEFTGLHGRGEGFVVDLPIPLALVWKRVLASDAGDPVAAELRARLAPGWLGREPATLLGVFAAVGLLAGVAGRGFARSRCCPRCGIRLCPRCDERASGGELCQPCTNLFLRPETTDRALRIARITALRERERRIFRASALVSVLVPGVAGLFGKRPVRGLVGAFFGCVAILAVTHRAGVVPDPLVAGWAGPVAFVAIATFCAGVHAIAVATSLSRPGSA